MNKLDFEEELFLKIVKLSENIWENRVKQDSINRWLSNFSTSESIEKCESTHAMFLLSQFMFFGVREVRELLKSVYRDKIKIPLIQKIRRNHKNTIDKSLIYSDFNQEISATRFLGMGNPSESGNHLLYFFRQENNLSKDLFIHTHQILSYDRSGKHPVIKLKDTGINRYVFLDDVCGSGTQAVEYSEQIIKEIKMLDPKVEVCYYALFSTSDGLKNVKENTLFDVVDCIFELDDSFRCFSEESRYFKSSNELPISKYFAEEFCKNYGRKLVGSNEHALGYKNGQMLIGFAHNVPDNTLPIIWSEFGDWKAVLRRYHKFQNDFYS